MQIYLQLFCNERSLLCNIYCPCREAIGAMNICRAV